MPIAQRLGFFDCNYEENFDFLKHGGFLLLAIP